MVNILKEMGILSYSPLPKIEYLNVRTNNKKWMEVVVILHLEMDAIYVFSMIVT